MIQMKNKNLLNVAICNAINPLATKTISAKNSISAKGELLLYGIIGDWWDGLDAKSIVEQLNALPGNEIVVRIQSPGGSVTEGLAMFNNLKQSAKTVKVFIDGIAASMGSAVAMAGDEINIPSNALFMLHKPSAMVGGNANELRDYADNLDVFEGSLLQIYSDRTGKAVDDIKALLSDGKDHYFRGQEAIDYGLADQLTDPVKINAKDSFFAELKIPDAYASALFVPIAAAAAKPTEEESMKIKIKAKGGGWHLVPAITAALENSYENVAEIVAAMAAKGVVITAQHLSGAVEFETEALTAVAVAVGIQVPAAAPAPVAPAAILDANAAVANERNRVKELRAVGMQARVTDVVVNGWIDDGITVVDARAKALEVVAQRDTSNAPAGTHIRMSSAAPRTELRTAMATAILNRVQPDQYKLDEVSGQFRGQNLMGMISTAMAFAGESVIGKTHNDLIAMAMHTTSDFPLILQEAANKVLRAAYDLQPRTFTAIAARTNADNFRAKRSLQIGGGTSLDKVNEKGEFKSGTVSESGESYKLETFGRIFSFTRQLMINDDLGALVRFFNQIGNLASRKESDVVWSLVKANPNMADGTSVYGSGATRKNLVAGAAINEATLTGLKKSHRQMVGLDGEPLNIAPKYLVVNTEREVEAQKMLEIIQAAQSSNVNVFARSMDLIVEARLDGVANNPFYSFADPVAVPTLEYAYLSGNEGPTTTTEWGFDTDGMKLKVVHDFGAGFVDFRGTAKGAGA